LRGEIDPVCAIAKPDIMVPSIFSATSLSPLRDIVAESIDWPKKVTRYLDVSVFAGFSYADVPNCGFSVVTVADGDRGLAARVSEELSGRLRAARHDLYKRDLVHGLREGVALALRKAGARKGPIVLLEHADRMNDSTHVLRELLRQGCRNAAVPYLWDPAAAAAAMAAGTGATVRLAIGGHSSPRSGGPVPIEGKVLFAGEKTYRVTGPMHHGRTVELGPTAVIDVGGVVVSVTTAPKTAIDEDPFIQFGMRPQDFDIIVLRSKTHFRAVYERIASEILIVDTPDWGPADLTTLPYRHVPRDRVFPFTDRP
ncbi:MAG TPA: MlrC C-terminal domain-containing protein, partial [Thermodesulfobacteriota bacterium]